MKIPKLLNPAYVYRRRSRIVPCLYAWTIQRILRFIARYGICFSTNERLLAALKDRYLGQRCFVIGNGPSLCIKDLSKLGKNGEVTIASNKIYLAFEETDWRPTYYTVADLLTAENNAEKIRNLDLIKLFPDHFKGILGESKDSDCNGIHLYYRMIKERHDEDGNYLPFFSSSPLIGFHVGETITHVNIQLAYYLGCNPIYLIGLDGVYQIPSTITSHHVYEQVFVSQGEINHFHKDYRKIGETWCKPKPEYHELAYQCCRQFLEPCGVTIKNASRNTSIRVFERVDLDSIL